MRKEDTEIHYRPELAAELRNIMDMTISLYERDPREVLYWVWAEIYDKENDLKCAQLLYEASKLFADKNTWLFANKDTWLSRLGKIQKLSKQFESFFVLRESPYIHEKYGELPKIDILAYQIQEYYRPGILSAAEAASILWKPYQKLILAEKEKIDTTGFTKAEKYAIDSFFNKILAPTRNPNIPHSYMDYRDYRETMDFSIEYIKEHCGDQLYFFETPDEELDEPQKQTM